MRITNKMVNNNILNSINNNREILNVYESQMATGKKIQKPSDDPIIAIRALNFRTTLKEIEQYKTNSEDAISWGEVSEQAVANITDMVERVRELSVQATSDTYNVAQRKNIATEISELFGQVMSEGNASYAGRYVFSGFKTDIPLTFLSSTTDLYQLNESFTAADFQTVDKVDNNIIVTANRIRLGYKGITNLDTTPLTGAGFAANVMNSSDPNAYVPAVGDVHILEDTGELIFNPADLATVPDPLNLTYDKNGFEKGELRPEHYYTGTNLTTGSVFTLQEEQMRYQVSYSQETTVNTRGYEVIGIDLARDLEELVDYTGKVLSDGSLTAELQNDILGNLFNEAIGLMDEHLDLLGNTRAVIGGKINRLELTVSRLQEDSLNFTDLLSNNEDVDYAEVLVNYSSMETVYNASLNASAKVIQPSLLDFIR